MDFERYTDRAKGFVQSAQSLALREGHQQFAPEHLLKVLLEDNEGAASGLIARAGGDAKAALQAVERLLAKRPKISGGGAGQLYLTPELARVFDSAEKIAEKAPIALQLTKEAVKFASRSNLDEGLRREVDLFAICFSTEDKKEGVAAFLEKRKPIFKGR